MVPAGGWRAGPRQWAFIIIPNGSSFHPSANDLLLPVGVTQSPARPPIMDR
jgi:hypothetical protein